MLPSYYGTLAEALRTTIRLEFRFLTDLFILYACDHLTKYTVFFHLIFLFCTTIRPNIKVHTDLLLYMHTTIRPKVRVFINFFILFVHDHSTKNYGLHWYISFVCTRPFDRNIWSSFFHLFILCARPFDQKIGSSLIYCFYLYTTIRLS